MALPKRAYTADYADLNHAVQSGMQQGSGGAARAYRGQARQSGTAGAYGGQAYPSYAPYPQRERRVKAWEERNLPKPQPQNAQTADTGILTRADFRGDSSDRDGFFDRQGHGDQIFHQQHDAAECRPAKRNRRVGG